MNGLLSGYMQIRPSVKLQTAGSAQRFSQNSSRTKRLIQTRVFDSATCLTVCPTQLIDAILEEHSVMF